MRGRSRPALAGSAPSRVHDRRKLWLVLVKLGPACPHPEVLSGVVTAHRTGGVFGSYMKEVVCEVAALGSSGRMPRTTSRRYRPEWGLYLTHSTPGDHTLVRPPGHWLRPHLSRPLGTTSVPWDKTVGSNQTTVSDERRWGQDCRPRGQIQGGRRWSGVPRPTR